MSERRQTVLRVLSPLLLCSALAQAGTAQAGTEKPNQDVTGTWEGGLRVRGQYLPMKLRLRGAGGVVTGELDLLQRGIVAWPLDEVVLAPPAVKLRFALPGGERRGAFEGELDGPVPTSRSTCRFSSAGAARTAT